MRTLGEIIREAIEARGISQGQAVMKTGVSQSAINNIIHGRRKAVRPEVLVALSEGLGLDPVELLYAAAGKEPPERPQPQLPPKFAALSELLTDDQLSRLIALLRRIPPEKRDTLLALLDELLHA